MASKTGWKKLGPYRAGKKRTDPPGPVAVFLDPPGPVAVFLDPLTTDRFDEGQFISLHGVPRKIEHLKKGESKYGN